MLKNAFTIKNYFFFSFFYFQGILYIDDFHVKMLKQVGLLTAGAQPWNSNICDAHGNWFAYCATLAIYIHEVSSIFQLYMNRLFKDN